MRKRPLILIIDDVPLNARILEKILDERYSSVTAHSGREGLELALLRQPDLILLDLMMPEMDGHQVFAKLRQNEETRNIPVIFVTADNDPDVESQLLSSGAVDFIRKPIRTDVVRARVRVHLLVSLQERALRELNNELQKRLHDLDKANTRLSLFSKAVEQSPTSIMITDRDGRIEYVNPHFSKETGFTAEEVKGKKPSILRSDLTSPFLIADMWDHLNRGESWHGDLANKRKSGELYWEEVHIAPVKNTEGATTHFVGVKLNITERKQIEERMRHMAHFDGLTQLPNRTLFFDRLRTALQLARRNDRRLALLYVDLDHFKPINDTHGHAIGDEVLRCCAHRMLGCVRASDTVGRIGGDEFMVLLHDIETEADVLHVARKLSAALAQEMVIDGLRLKLSSSIGCAVFPDHADNETTLAHHADFAMYQIKHAGGDHATMFSPEDSASQPDQLEKNTSANR